MPSLASDSGSAMDVENNAGNGKKSKGVCCFFCSELMEGMEVADNVGSDKRTFFFSEMVMVLHKLLQIPLWDVSRYMSEKIVRDPLKFCSGCSQIVEEGKVLLGEIERLQLRLQTVQATLQNQLLVGQNDDGQDSEQDERAGFRELVKEKIRKSLNDVASPLKLDSLPVKNAVEDIEKPVGSDIRFADLETELPVAKTPSPDAAVNRHRAGPVYPAPAFADRAAALVTETLHSAERFQTAGHPHPHPTTMRNQDNIERGSFPIPSSSQASSSRMVVEADTLKTLLNRVNEVNPSLRLRVGIWQGTLMWNRFIPPDYTTNVTRLLRCKVFSEIQGGVPAVTGQGWPSSFVIELVPKAVIQKLDHYFTGARTAVVGFDGASAGEVSLLREAMENDNGNAESGFAGVIVFHAAAATCTEQVMILMHLRAGSVFFVAFPKDQSAFLDELWKLLSKRK